MKRKLKIFILLAFFATAPLLMFAQTGSPTDPPHPWQPTDPAHPGTKVGDTPAGAPIGNGTFILLTLAAAYAGRKVYVMRTEEEVA